ncbi:MAG: DUF4392 domain-containing protein [Clostridia bacterium]|jgi:hypothetical protein
MSGDKAEKSSPAATCLQSDAIARLEGLARHDPGGRGLSSKAPVGLLGPAADALLSARRVLIITGFCVRSAMIGETDGPPGASALASCLSSLGATAMILTDRHSSGLVAAALATRKPLASKSPAGTDTASMDTGLPTAITVLPDGNKEAARFCLDLAADFRPDLILAVERPGAAADGHRYSMRGTILDDIAPSADILFTSPGDSPGNRTWKTAAIGDGGNELGMGSLRDSCVAAVAMGEQIFCAADSDFPVAAGISNWGAYALAGAVSILAGRAVLPSPEEEMAVLQAVYEAGGVDGATKEHTCSVDGLPADEYLQTIRQMYKLVMEWL